MKPGLITTTPKSEASFENRLIKSAATRLLLLPGIAAPLRRRLGGLVAALREVGEVESGRPPDVRFTRLNARYRNAVGLARLILEGVSIRYSAGSVAAVSFLVDMNQHSKIS